MTDVPRRLRPDPAKRSRTIQTQTHTAHSAQGTTAAARPVRQTSRARPYVPASTLVTGDTTGQDQSTAIRSTTGTNEDTVATGERAGAFGYGASATALRALAGGFQSVASGEDGTAWGGSAKAVVGARGSSFGHDSYTSQDDGCAFGSGSRAFGARSVALGFAAEADDDDDFVLGNVNHNVQVPGKFILTDSSGGQWQLVVDTSGALSTVAYP